MGTYRSHGFQPVDAGSHREAAQIFAARLAHREYGQRGHCRSLRLDCHTEDERSYTWEAFIGRPTQDRTATSGGNVWIYTSLASEAA